MIKINLLKGQNLEKNNVYFQIDQGEKKLLNFEELKIFAESILEDIKNQNNNDYEINCEKGLELYKETIQNIIDGIKTDQELQRLYCDTK